ncbi:MAG TPA: twin-arginine translocase TatA/TatE family subunit [Flavobacterium sp.]|jgi:sec-independent protein translocase protein TatA
MFGIGGSELIFIILIAVMLFGADKIPEIARTLGKGMAQLKNATDDIKNEIHKSAIENDVKALTRGVTEEIGRVKQNITTMASEQLPDNPIDIKSITEEVNAEIEKAKINIEDITDGPIKRQS